MAIFKKQSPLEGNPCTSTGIMLEFSGLYYETEDEAEIEFLSGFKCYSQVQSKDTEAPAAPRAAKAVTGTVTAAKLNELASKNT